ncbi:MULTISPECIES: hypothetical protein [Nocardia]|uniref:Alkylation response protein AidB-like acyl-CoA dehydrogenase n=2 Tax=Nocardia TaxID=1817 RepID=A0A846XJU4_9NOCA|nr:MULTISPECIES: hypothetical protein [Nocardia]MBF6456024.1 hypothetical protein [Nocardia cyriacigeorgica]MBF6553235.1 hypothetical protein [Nocardia cyriacigeorgica]NKY34853.1 hypothetical protein [Nocardia speluncae]TLF77684.1 hypothetical protein FEK34_15385 [Nocardia cyriacigeorgica]
MTTTLDQISPIGYQGDDPTVAALRDSIYGPYLATYRKARELIMRLGDVPQDHLPYALEAGIAPDLLRSVLSEVGVPAREITADTHLRGALGDWAAVAAPHLLTVWTGHFDLAIGAIATHGTGAPYQQQCLADLDTGAAVGVLALTELGGTNGADQQMQAVWDRDADGFWLSSPTIGSVKGPPNIADNTVPKIVVFSARLIFEGRDEGVFLFLSRLRTVEEGLADGVEVGEMSSKLGAAMDHGWALADRLFVPREGFLGGEWATITDDGEFRCDEADARWRCHRSISPLVGGRLDLATANIAAARAGVAGLVNYSKQRPHGHSDVLQRDLVTSAAHAYAGSVLGRLVRDLSTDPGQQERLPLWMTVVKPVLTTIAEKALRTCSARGGAQGQLRCNYYPDWNANARGSTTAEGDNQVLEKSAGRTHQALSTLILPGTPTVRPWWLDMIITRETILATDLYTATGIDQAGENYEPDGTALGIDSIRADLARTTGARLMATAALIVAEEATDPTAATVARACAAVVALTYLDRHSGWYNAHRQQAPDLAEEIHDELRHNRVIVTANQILLAAAFDIPELPDAPMFAPDYLQAWSDRAGWDKAKLANR